MGKSFPTNCHIKRSGHMSDRLDPYRNLADVYDEMASDPELQKFYQYWRKLLLQAISERNLKVRTIVDLMCGTGNSTVPWVREAGWSVIGVDGSAAMLRHARRKSDRVTWYHQDIRKLRIKERAEVVTCHFDALNHILSPEELQLVFKHVAGILNPGGLFLFDISTEHWFRWLHKRDMFSRIGKNYMVSTNQYNQKSRIVEFRQFWFIPKGRLYKKRLVHVQERPYTTSEIRLMARASGFRVLKTKQQWVLEGKPVRLAFVLEKKPSITGTKKEEDQHNPVKRDPIK
ncbi:MAG: class I SAM-dependent methyltransferase [Acidobacteriota bacterium]